MYAMFDFYQPVSSLTHLIAGIITLGSGYFLIRRGWGNKLRVLSLLVFMAGIVFVFMMSGVYHALEPGLGRDVFRRLDYAAIFTMIAGTATPIHVILFRGIWRWGMLIYLWFVAIAGLLLTVILLDQIPEWLTLSVFIAMGWSALMSMLQAWRLYGFHSISFAFYGGLAYSLGAAIDFTRSMELMPGFIGPHEIFHVFVIIGAAFHWFLIYRWANQPTRNKIVFMVKEQADDKLWARSVGESYEIFATSRKELRNKIREMLNARVHPRLVPQKVRFRFYKDVVVSLPK
jgi:channel protein (hemolysin III family)